MSLRFPNRSTHPELAPWIMGILNVTPDSFSDGGRYLAVDDAVARAEGMIAEGADVIDIGPESTRPGAGEVPADVQVARAVPVIRALRARFPRVPMSIDTRRADVAEAALDAGADLVNDTSALRDDDRMVALLAERGCSVVLMHRRGTPATMQAGGGPVYEDAVGEISEFLAAQARLAESRGVEPSRIILDPGIGFGKRVQDNVAIFRSVERFAALGYPLLIGASRKRFLGTLLGEAESAPRSEGWVGQSAEAPVHWNEPPAPAVLPNRFLASLAAAGRAVLGGASVVRVHDVGPTRSLVTVLLALSPSHGIRGNGPGGGAST